MRVPEEFKNNPIIQDLIGQRTAQEHVFRSQRVGSARDAAKQRIDALEREIRDKVHELQLASEKAKTDSAFQDQQRKLTWKQLLVTGVIAFATSVVAATLTAYLTARWSNDDLRSRVDALESLAHQSKLSSDQGAQKH